MDEVDGMSAGDRGGVQDLIKTIKRSKVPIVAICNDRYHQKLKSLRNHCLELTFSCAPCLPRLRAVLAQVKHVLVRAPACQTGGSISASHERERAAGEAWAPGLLTAVRPAQHQWCCLPSHPGFKQPGAE